MKKAFCVLIFSSICFTYSCIETYNLDLPEESKLVVDGLITNDTGPYYIRLTESRNNLYFDPYMDSLYIYTGILGGKSIKDALVIISSDNGQTDTLVAGQDSIAELYLNENGEYVYTNLAENLHGIKFGGYQTTTLKGEVGVNYFLRVIWKGKEYNASCIMPDLPQIDSITYNKVKAAVGKDDYFVPKIYFREPKNEKNYYLFNFSGNNRVWGYSILNDEFLGDYVKGVDVFKGESVDWYMSAYPYGGEQFKIRMYSITKETYDFYKALINQYKNDGGSYSLVPASPPTNIDNGGLGFFRASSVNRISGVMPEK
jgi:hypothetical protein